MLWEDIVDCSSNCPAVQQSATFLTQCKIKKQAAWRPQEALPVMAARVPAHDDGLRECPIR
jgi:hypothetical protein